MQLRTPEHSHALPEFRESLWQAITIQQSGSGCKPDSSRSRPCIRFPVADENNPGEPCGYTIPNPIIPLPQPLHNNLQNSPNPQEN